MKPNHAPQMRRNVFPSEAVDGFIVQPDVCPELDPALPTPNRNKLW
jgi:hypothetical protein